MKRLSSKRRAQDDADAETLAQYNAEHLSCAVCWYRAGQFGGWLETHHLAGRGHHWRNKRANLIRLCNRCHGHYHRGMSVDDKGERLPDLTPGMLLTAKRESDAIGYDVQVLLTIKGWKGLPDNWQPTPIPAAFLGMRR